MHYLAVTRGAITDGNTADLAAYAPSTTLTINKGSSGTVSITGVASTFSDVAQYKFNLITAKGHTLTYTTTYDSNPSL